MWTRIVTAVLISSLSIGCATSSEDTAASAERRAKAQEKTHRAKIGDFAALAANGKVDALVKEFGEITLQANGKEAVERYLQENIVPFFRDYDAIAEDGRSMPVTDGKGNIGAQYYEFKRSKDGKLEPFVITLFDTDGKAKVTSIEVGECLRDYHARCP